jgi:hypothetical protein
MELEEEEEEEEEIATSLPSQSKESAIWSLFCVGIREIFGQDRNQLFWLFIYGILRRSSGEFEECWTTSKTLDGIVKSSSKS